MQKLRIFRSRAISGAKWGRWMLPKPKTEDWGDNGEVRIDCFGRERYGQEHFFGRGECSFMVRGGENGTAELGDAQRSFQLAGELEIAQKGRRRLENIINADGSNEMAI